MTFENLSLLFVNKGKRRRLHHPYISERSRLILYAIQLHEPRQTVVIQPGNATHAHSPLRGHGTEHLKRLPHIGQDLHRVRLHIFQRQPKRGQFLR